LHVQIIFYVFRLSFLPVSSRYPVEALSAFRAPDTAQFEPAQMRDVSLVEARQQIYQDLQNSGTTNYALGNWRKKKDRLALCHYLLTRELLEADVGSIAMFAIPPDMSLQRPRNEHFLHPLSETVRTH
jgi:hypothetical protein